MQKNAKNYKNSQKIEKTIKNLQKKHKKTHKIPKYLKKPHKYTSQNGFRKGIGVPSPAHPRADLALFPRRAAKAADLLDFRQSVGDIQLSDRELYPGGDNNQRFFRDSKQKPYNFLKKPSISG